MTEQHDKHPKRCRVCGAEISHLNPGLCKNFHYQNIPEKDDVHWITGQELREIYADKLSLDKYDEIRKRPAAKVENVPLCGFFGQIDCCQTPDVRGACTVSEQCVKYYRDMDNTLIRRDKEVAEAAAEARKDEREKVLKEIMYYVRKSKYFGKHFMLIMCESLQNPATPAVKEQKP